MEVINTNINYVIEVDDLSTTKSYTAHLWDKSSGEKVIATTTGPTNGISTFTFSGSSVASNFDDGTVLTLEIFDSDHNAIWYKDRFARVRQSSVTAVSTTSLEEE